MKSLLASLAALAVLLLGMGGAQAIQTGTPAWTIRPLVLLEGPGAAYDVVGDVGAGLRVYVERCQKRWCDIRTDSGRGWVSEDHLSFGRYARGTWTGTVLNYKSGGPGTVCLYEGRNYTGASICGHSGFVIRDLLLHKMDNRFSSVSVEGNVSVMLCRDRFFQNYCERVNDSMPVLQGFLDNGLSSLRVY